MRRPQSGAPQQMALAASGCCLSIVLLWGDSRAIAQATPVPRPVARKPVDTPGVKHTATIDLQRVLAESQSFQESLKEIQAKDTERRKPIEELRRKIRNLEELVAQFVVGSPNHAEASKKLFKAQGELNATEREADYELDRAEAALYVDFYRLIQKTIAEYAEHHNIGIVLNRTPAPDFAPERKQAEALFEHVVAFDRHVDITDDILLQLSKGKVKPRVPETMSE